MKIKWLGHSCFKIEQNGYSIVLDPYKKSAMLRLNDLNTEANEVLCSHEHSDHNYKEAVKLIKSKDKSPFNITRLLSYHDKSKGEKRGENFIAIIETDALKVAHLGDLGHPLNDSQINSLLNLDVLMIPVGGFFTIDPQEAKEICDKLKPRIIIPMHYKGKKFGPLMLAKVEAFTELFKDKPIKNYDTDSIDVDKSTEEQVAVLKFTR